MSVVQVMKRILIYGGLLAAAIAVVGGIVGFATAGGRGLLSAIVGTVMAVVFLGITSGSVVIATKVAKGDMLNVAFFGIIMGAWLVKFVVFIVLILLLRDQPWVQTVVLILCLVVAVLGTLVVDVVVIARSRMPYVSDVSLPGNPD